MDGMDGKNLLKGVLGPALPAGALSHAYIVWGGSGRDALARQLASAALCAGEAGARPCGTCAHCVKSGAGIHPDLTVLDRAEGKREITVDQIRALREDAFILPNEARKKVYIIQNAGDMNASAQNALLKLLEEPPRSVMLILTAGSEAELLDTVRSRCVSLQYGAEDAADPAYAALADAFFDAAAKGATALCAFSFRLDRLGGAEMSAFLDAATAAAVRALKDAETGAGARLSSNALMGAIRALDEAKKYAALYVSSVHISGLLCAALLDSRKGEAQ